MSYNFKDFDAQFPDDAACLHHIFRARFANHVCECGHKSNVVPIHAMQTLEDSGKVSTLNLHQTRTKNRTTHHFDFEGRQRTLFKIGSTWYFYRELHGKRLKRSLKTSAVKAAEEKAKNYFRANTLDQIKQIDAIYTGDNDPKQASYSKLSAVFDWLDRATLNISDGTRTGYLTALQRFVKKGGGIDDARAASAGIITPATVRAYFDHATREAQKHADQHMANRVKRSALSDMNKVKSFFSQINCADMASDGVNLPDLAPFQLEVKVRWKKFAHGLGSRQERLPADDLISKTGAAWQTLPDRNEFIAVGLMLSCGLRVSTIGQVKTFWATTSNGHPYLNSAANTKDGTGALYVRPIDPAWRILWERITRENWRPAADDYLLAGTFTERTGDVFIRTSKWLRALGWQTQKTNHALRAYAIGMVILKYGLEAARDFATHKNSATTEMKYGYLIKPGQRTLTPEQVPVEWAK